MKLKGLMALLALGCLIGCTSADYSQNMRVATVRATGGVATKAMLDEIPIDKYEKAKSLTVTVAQDLKLFCDNGKLADLPFDLAQNKIIAYMQKKGWEDFVPVVMGIMSIIETQRVPTEKLGADNIYLIKTGLDEVIESAQSSKAEWRRPTNRGFGGKKVLPPNKVQLYRK